jgi:parallel beta-helix repeat protein
MFRKPQFLLSALIMTTALGLLPARPALASTGTTYYVDCAATTNGDGSEGAPWNNIASVNSASFVAGDTVLFARGTTCSGSLIVTSSGTSTAPITFGAYGSGALPIIDGTGYSRAVKLLDASYVVVEDLDIRNSEVWGVLVTSDNCNTVYGITLENLVVHHVINPGTVGPLAKWTGDVVFAPGVIKEFDPLGTNTKSGEYTTCSHIDGILVDNVQAYDTTQWSGIMVWGVNVEGDMQWESDSQNQSLQSRNITIENSTVHDTYGEGIAVFMSYNGTIQSNVVYNTGNVPLSLDPNGWTPVGLWWWSSEDMVGQLNESYDNHSPGVDGGGYDIDYHSHDSLMQYNYGHGNNTYCISVFGYKGATTNVTVRYNICAADGVATTRQKCNLANGQCTTVAMDGDSEFYVCTWDGGSITNNWIYNNTVYITSSGSSAGVINDCPSGGDSEIGSFFENNLVTSTIANIWGNTTVLNNRLRDYNLWYYTGGNLTDATPEAHGLYNENPQVNDFGYSSAGRPTTQWTLQSGSPAIAAGTDVCSGLSGCSMGSQDFYGDPLPSVGPFNIGAFQ